MSSCTQSRTQHDHLMDHSCHSIENRSNICTSFLNRKYLDIGFLYKHLITVILPLPRS